MKINKEDDDEYIESNIIYWLVWIIPSLIAFLICSIFSFMVHIRMLEASQTFSYVDVLSKTGQICAS